MPSGSMSLIEEAGRQLLAACPAFQAFTATADATAALARIYRDDVPSPADGKAYTLDEHQALRPCAVVRLPPAHSLRFSRIADQYWAPSGQLEIQILRSLEDTDVLGGRPTAEADSEMDDLVGAILDELLNRSGGNVDGTAYLDFTEAEITAGPYGGDPKRIAEMGLWQGVDLLLTFDNGRQ